MANRTVTARTGGTGIDTTDFKNVIRVLRKEQPELAKQVRKQLRVAGEIVAAEARRNAAEFSKTIPPTIKVRTAGATVAVIAGGAKAPAASLFELGNTGGSKSATASLGGRFRHPVFGDRDVWVETPSRPYIRPSIAKDIEAVASAVAEAVADLGP